MKKNTELPNWYKIDNAGKMFQVVHKPYCDCVYRIGINLKEDINPAVLEKAVNDLKNRFPTFFVKVKKGFFWYYFEENKNEIKVKPETAFINQYVDPALNNDFMFAFYYYKNRISFECLHAISDGYGAMEFIKAIIFRYLELLGKEVYDEGIIKTKDQEVDPAELEDSYVKYYTKNKIEREKIAKAYRPLGKKLDKRKGFALIYGKMDSGELLAVARKYNSSITQYLTALYVYSVLKTHKDKLKNLPIGPCVPVNLRSIFPSITLRNFSLVFYCPIYPRDGLTFEEILEQVKKFFVEGVKKEKMQTFLNANVRIEKMWIMRIIPRVLKTLAIRIGKKNIGDVTNTRSITNLGVIKLPKSVAEHILDMECSNTDGVAIMTVNSRTTISFTRTIIDTKIELFFFSALAEEGIKVEIQSNLKEEIN